MNMHHDELPPGYEVYQNAHGDWLFALEDADEREPMECETRDEAVIAAWRHWKASC